MNLLMNIWENNDHLALILSPIWTFWAFFLQFLDLPSCTFTAICSLITLWTLNCIYFKLPIRFANINQSLYTSFYRWVYSRYWPLLVRGHWLTSDCYLAARRSVTQQVKLNSATLQLNSPTTCFWSGDFIIRQFYWC